MLGPTVAVASMAAFIVSLLALGWGPGQPWPSDAGLAAASGATFMTIVLGQKANVFACRISTRRPGEIGWTTNRLLFFTGAVEFAFAFVVLFVPWLAHGLDHACPPMWGWVVAIGAMPLVLLVDAIEKRLRRHR